MPPIQRVFKRYEKKYLMNPEQYEQVKTSIEKFMTQDIYGLHTICNIYYDTDQYQLIRTSIEKPVYKEKFRIRSYGTPGPCDNVFLEIKKKYKGIVTKRRIATSLEKAQEYLEEGKPSIERTQILNEIDYIIQQNHLKPKVFIAYDRIAYYGNEDPEVRLTIDTNMRFREKDLSLAKGDQGEQILKEKKYLMEVKIPGSMPLWLSEILTRYKIYPASFSKYGTCYTDELWQMHQEDIILEENSKDLLQTEKNDANNKSDEKVGGMSCA